MRRAAAVWAAALVLSCGLLALPLVALAATSAVNIQGSAFNPPTITVHPGDTVTWTNRDAFSHTATSDTAGAFDTGVISAGASRSITFTIAGTFAYHCAIHAFMHGTIVVQAVNTPQPTPPPTAPPTPVRTAPPTTAPPTPAPTEAPTPEATTPAPSASASPVAVASESASASPSTVAAQLTPAPTPSGGSNAPLLIGAAAIAVVALGALAFFLARRS